MSEQQEDQRDAILNELERLLEFHFPDETLTGNNPNWSQEPYRGDFFALCRVALGLVSSDDFGYHCRGQWNIRRQHPLTDKEMDRLYQLIAAWGEWQYAMRRLDRPGQQ